MGKSVFWSQKRICLDREQSKNLEFISDKSCFPSHVRKMFWVTISYKYHDPGAVFLWDKEGFPLARQTSLNVSCRALETKSTGRGENVTSCQRGIQGGGHQLLFFSQDLQTEKQKGEWRRKTRVKGGRGFLNDNPLSNLIHFECFGGCGACKLYTYCWLVIDEDLDRTNGMSK